LSCGYCLTCTAAQINLDALAAHFGVKQDDDDPAAAPKRAEMKKQKDALVEALVRKGRALVERNMTAGSLARFSHISLVVECYLSSVPSQGFWLERGRR
jgi:hypothetical protein